MANKRTFEIVIAGNSQGAEKTMKDVQLHASAFGSAVTGAMFGVGQMVANTVMDMGQKFASFAFESITKFEDLAFNTRKVMRETGMSATDASQLIGVARDVGVSAETLQKNFKLFDKTVADHPDKLAKLGISVRDANGALRPMSDIVADVSDRFVKMGDGAEATALAQQLFGRTGIDMMPILQLGGKAIQDNAAELSKYGLVLDDAAMQKGLAAKKATRELGMAWEGLQVQLGQYLAPVLKDIAKWMGDHLPQAIAEAKKWLKEHKEDFEKVGKAIKDAFEWAKDNVPKALDWIKDHADQAGRKLDEWFGEDKMGNFQRGADKTRQEWDKLAKKWEDTWGTSEDLSRGLQVVGGWLGWVKDNAYHLTDAVKWLDDHGIDPLIGSLQKLFGWFNDIASNSVFQALMKVSGGAITTSIGVVSSLVSGHADGSPLTEGWNTVGEQGPEMIYKAGGSTTVLTAGQTAARGSGGGGGHVTVNVSAGAVVHQTDLAEYVRNALLDLQRTHPSGILPGVTA